MKKIFCTACFVAAAGMLPCAASDLEITLTPAAFFTEPENAFVANPVPADSADINSVDVRWSAEENRSDFGQQFQVESDVSLQSVVIFIPNKSVSPSPKRTFQLHIERFDSATPAGKRTVLRSFDGVMPSINENRTYATFVLSEPVELSAGATYGIRFSFTQAGEENFFSWGGIRQGASMFPSTAYRLRSADGEHTRGINNPSSMIFFLLP